MKRKGSIIGFFTLIFIITAFFIIKNLTETRGGKINTYIAMNLKLDKILNPKSTNEQSIEKIRERLNRESTKLSKPTITFSNIKNTTVDVNAQKIPLRIYTPESQDNLPIIIYSHGGSWISGNLDTHDNVCRKLAQNTKAIVISVDYRLAPENPFPAGLNDVYNVLQWTYNNAQNINGNKKQIAVVGDSAGGNLSAAVSLMARNKSGPQITCQVLIYPSTNIYELNTQSWSYFANDFNISLEDMEKYISLYIPQKEDRKNDYASPLLATNLKDLPDALIVTAEIDPLRDDGEAYGNKLKEAGIHADTIRFNGVTHGFITMDKITDKADNALNQISLYLQNKFQK